ncbi:MULTISPECIES: hydantoinase B/oxoprolinase family protein [Pseudomonas]|uniref:Hydantoinase B/oxoprolinase family protein n=1 Tax=Pseudomonas juntendi TaxID=2666183 RepID=A0ABD4YI45_9PSED|nr:MULTISPECIES: hydantoinase B/oxoprolinase family protein [Pseudomonas]MDH0759191.1 hydantoinase B/oxoprolinase family protein [Pseudomonas juntendi]MDH1575427.1 hydantoinase B/oxoprolinase family protein [Pseudomonas sp. GD03746]MDH1919939.1 hydantoinase B/oxoprolinase family protein [Pseudomonas juntendi]QUN68623.1 hydantoinase B/oxoprolinase family protein [Pseudomonas sp. JS425]
MSQANPFTCEVIKNALVAIGEEMFIALKRTSMSPIIYEALDYGIGLTDARGQLISQGNGIPGFIGTLDGAVRSVLEKFDLHDIQPGDMFITNDPYGGGGTHLSDVSMIMPVFHEQRLIAWTANKAHWTEVGGKDPGSFSSDASEIYQEGLQFPTVRIYDRGRINQALVDVIAANVRLPEMTIGDLHACAAALRVGERRLLSLVAKYGEATTLDAMERLLEHGEAMVLECFKTLPKGVFHAEDVIDEDGLGNGPFWVKVRVEISDSRFLVDFTGSSLQAPGPINNTLAGLQSAVREVFMGVVRPGIPANAGCFRPVEVICPSGTICTAERPAPVSAYFESMVTAADVIRRALAPLLPDRLIAGQLGSVCSMVLNGHNSGTGEEYLLVQPLVGGWGAGQNKDGESGQFCVGNGETSNIPVEITERCYEVLVERYAFNEEGGGAGRKRGGRGVVLDYRILSPKAWVSTFFGRGVTPPWGIEGGSDGSCNYAEVTRADGRVQRFSRANRVPLEQGDLLRLVTANGGGWGPADERSLDEINGDIAGGYLTSSQAMADYPQFRAACAHK